MSIPDVVAQVNDILSLGDMRAMAAYEDMPLYAVSEASRTLREIYAGQGVFCPATSFVYLQYMHILPLLQMHQLAFIEDCDEFACIPCMLAAGAPPIYIIIQMDQCLKSAITQLDNLLRIRNTPMP